MGKSGPLKTPDEYHDEADIIAALNELSDKDIRYLVGFGRYRILGARGAADNADAEDLFSEAVAQTLKLKRKWKRGVTFPNHLLACMRSIADNRFKHARRHVELALELPAPAGIDLIAAMDAGVNIMRLQEGLENDSIALSVLETMLDGCVAAQAEQRLRISSRVYWAARKRIRRLAQKLVEEDTR